MHRPAAANRAYPATFLAPSGSQAVLTSGPPRHEFLSELAMLERQLTALVPALLIDHTAAGRTTLVATIRPRVEHWRHALTHLAPATLAMLRDPPPTVEPGRVDQLVADVLTANRQLHLLLTDLGIAEYQHRTGEHPRA